MRKGHIAGIGFAFLVAAQHHGVAAHESFGEDFCEPARATGLILGCDVQGRDRNVVTFIHASCAEVAWICRGITDIMKGQGTPPQVVIIMQDQGNRDGVRNIEFRVDKREMKRIPMTSHQRYLMIFDRRKAGRFIDQLRSAKLLTGRSYTMDGRRIEFRIPINDFDDVERHLD